MEALLKGVVGSTHPVQLKKALLEKILQGLTKDGENPMVTVPVFKLFMEWILISDDPEIIRLGMEQMNALAHACPSSFYEFVSPNIIIEIFTNPTNTNKVVLVQCLGLIFDLVHKLGSDIRADHIRCLCNITRSHLFPFLKEHGVQLDVAVEVSKVYLNHPALLPPEQDWTKFCLVVIHLLAGFRRFSHEPEVKRAFWTKTEHVSRMLPLVWGRSESVNGVQECLKAFYVIISKNEENFTQPSSALSCLMEKIPSHFLNVAADVILRESSQQQGEANAVIALQTMLEWLSLDRTNAVTSVWLHNILKGLRDDGRNSILIEIGHTITERLLLALTDIDLAEFAEPVFFFLLLGFQHSESVFHSVVTDLPKVLREIHRQGNEVLLNRLSEAVQFLIIIFPDFPELYDPVNHVLSELNQSQPDQSRIEELKSLSWLDAPVPTHQLNKQIQKKRLSGLVEDNLLSRSDTGMVGLVNLGNTCYMNSVLQALFITKDFCNGILQAPLSSQEPVLLRLQRAFAFLRHTRRSIYSPSDLLRHAKPPWFENGRQQDCCEFLRHLLDTLHEQEKLGHRSREVHQIKADQFKEQSIAITTDVVIDNEDSVRPNKSSSLALDVIAELPEQGKEADEEMLSQSSEPKMDEDFFGSRGSLMGGPTSLTRLDSEDEEDNDFHGSRTSLGSNGLKRWTTEGNLSSFDGSREGKMDLLDGPLHNSHSNSTDSGIQSVGDSIRGSSDSMTNPQPMDVTPTNPIPSKGVAKCAAMPAASDKTDNSSAQLVSLVHSLFGGKLRTNYKCSNCSSVSQHEEVFTDLNLAITAPTTAPMGDGQSKLNVQSLLTSYLEPEDLVDDNKYHCDRCQSLQDANKTIQILEAPQYLMCTLLRFKYDRTLNRKSKVCTEIDYENTIDLPLLNSDPLKYDLYAAVVHSGYSSDGGHYFTYARDPKPASQDTEGDGAPWFIFNDSRVSFTTFDDFKNISKQSRTDTAYLLLYCRRENVSNPQKVTKKTLRSDLKTMVEKDNLEHLRERERSNSSSTLLSSAAPLRRDDDDTRGPGPGPSGCGENGFNTPGHFVC